MNMAQVVVSALEGIKLDENIQEQLASRNAQLYVKMLKLTDELTQMQSNLYKELNELEKAEIKVVMSKAEVNNYPEYLTTQDVAKLLKISTQMVRRYCADGKIDATQRMEGTGAWLIKTEQFLDHPDLLKVLNARENAREKNRNKSIGFANSMLKLLNE
ncbi:helix-turn-helix domain-containing protein [Bacillus cereus]|uniref:helix-turn-helix domain-containing protein n=1 Tax=Bacillus cereus TaxID=1396 RepID=UPI00227BF1D9|nr:helix-turn-helix domain-containing protein [Bacillus cereus]MDA1850298.1 helix-turn-helix domain-containing protein [Bacillus cereus]WAI17443.1 helix-turn-helix domain-containing protein [Bacillus cereus]